MQLTCIFLKVLVISLKIINIFEQITQYNCNYGEQETNSIFFFFFVRAYPNHVQVLKYPRYIQYHIIHFFGVTDTFYHATNESGEHICKEHGSRVDLRLTRPTGRLRLKP